MKIVCGLFFILLSLGLAGQDAAGLMTEGARLETIMHDAEALSKYKEVLRVQPSNIAALCRCSELCSRMANRIKEKRSRDDYYQAARSYAEAAIRLNPASADANFVMSVVMGRVAMTKSGKEKISAARDIKKYADLAIAYDPLNYKAWHVLGKWYYEVCNLNSFEKIGISLFYGGIPRASWVDAIHAYEKSRELAPHFLINYLELARTYHRNDQDQKAIALLKMVPALPNKTEDDVTIREASAKMLKDLE